MCVCTLDKNSVRFGLRYTLGIRNNSPPPHSKHVYLPGRESRPKCYTKAPTVQDVFQSIP